ncbi:plastid lipid-associated protein 3 chloroplastic [Tripterygium wilfordii]|uniref:Plastid lipid-associated protein 3 chloroplastic n=1 Tax=Tripterygium wilfordii TaxID=458696 RepID=A0A7J7C6F5_TRIWF|nr:plastid lipid-associated protein 3, chloroplastic [Tripterygium wilfordii]KAF5729720.1 plastid lipid-associated protein 3 chloroplastic [Tripterygium wilfordii]
MALSFISGSSIVFSDTPKALLPYSHLSANTRSIPFRVNPNKPLAFATTITQRRVTRFPSLLFQSSLSNFTPDPEDDPYQTSNRNSDPNPSSPSPARVSDDEWGEKSVSIRDEWGEKTEPEIETTRLSDSDPPRNEDEWQEEYVSAPNGTPASGKSVIVEEEDRLGDLKRGLADTVYGTDIGFRASPEVRGEVLELVNQLEALNPTPAPVDASDILDGNWVLLYTAFSELLPLLAVGVTPLLKVKSICQTIDTRNLSIVNSTTLSSPFATFSFSASATFEVRSPSRIQVEFKEGILQPPEIKSSVDLPGNLDIFGQTINLSPVQQSLGPLQEAVASISRAISGQPPLKVPIPGNRSRSWLLITYLDKDLRISRGDGGLFVLAKEGSPLLDQ